MSVGGIIILDTGSKISSRRCLSMLCDCHIVILPNWGRALCIRLGPQKIDGFSIFVHTSLPSPPTPKKGNEVDLCRCIRLITSRTRQNPHFTLPHDKAPAPHPRIRNYERGKGEKKIFLFMT